MFTVCKYHHNDMWFDTHADYLLYKYSRRDSKPYEVADLPPYAVPDCMYTYSACAVCVTAHSEYG